MKKSFTFKIAATLMMMLLLNIKLQAQSCQAGFSYSPPDLNGVVVFQDTSWSQDQILSWYWDLGDGTLATTPIYTHIYTSNGTYQVCLIIESATCIDTVCQYVAVTLGNPCIMLAAIAADTSANTLTAVATMGMLPYTYLWSTGATTNQITTTAAGNYCVTVTDALGCSNTNCYNYAPNVCNNVFTYFQTSPGVYQFVSSAQNGQGIIWDFGDGTAPDTSVNNQISHNFSLSASYMVCMTVVGCNPYCSAVYVQGFPTSILCGNVFNDANGNSILDSTETGLGGLYLFIYGTGIQQTAFTDSITGNFSFNVPPGTYTVQMCPSGGLLQNGIITVPAQTVGVPPTSCASYAVTIGSNDTLCGLNFGVFTNASTVSGTLYYDLNNNGILDIGETGLPYQIIHIGSYVAYTDVNGFYSLTLPIGNYPLSYSPSGFYSSGIITTLNLTAYVTQNGTTYGNNNIGLYMTPGQVDLSITIHPSTTVTPGFGAWYSINVCNNGTTPTGATILMQYDPVLTPNYQNPIASNVNTSNNLITWNVPAINPGACYYIWVTFNAIIGTPLGSNTIEVVSVNPTTGIDNNMNNNTDTIHQIVVGSWDPNNKLVDYTNTIDPNFQMESTTNPNQEIRYTINFQNTGNAPAHNVVVIDEMSNNLDVTAYEFIGASHNCVIQRNGNETTYKFMNIMLPDSTNNEPASHGFISYKLNALSSLTIGDQMIDYANIYFDFNAPVLTEDAVITVVGPTAAASILSNDQINMYPNPADDFVNVNVQSKSDGNVNITIADATGKVCLQQQRTLKAGYNKLVLNTAELSKGIYFVQTTSNDGVVKTSKLSVK